MNKRLFTMVLLAGGLVFLPGCSVVKPIKTTINTAKRVVDTTGKVYNTSRAVADLVNPLEVIYYSESQVAGDESMAASPCGPVPMDAGQGVTVYDPDTGEVLGVIPGLER